MATASAGHSCEEGAIGRGSAALGAGPLCPMQPSSSTIQHALGSVGATGEKPRSLPR